MARVESRERMRVWSLFGSAWKWLHLKFPTASATANSYTCTSAHPTSRQTLTATPHSSTLPSLWLSQSWHLGTFGCVCFLRKWQQNDTNDQQLHIRLGNLLQCVVQEWGIFFVIRGISSLWRVTSKTCRMTTTLALDCGKPTLRSYTAAGNVILMKDGLNFFRRRLEMVQPMRPKTGSDVGESSQRGRAASCSSTWEDVLSHCELLVLWAQIWCFGWCLGGDV